MQATPNKTTVGADDFEHFRVTDRVSAQGDTYEDAKATLEAALPEGTKLIVIRTDR